MGCHQTKKAKIINQNNEKENKKRLKYEYTINDRILIKNYTKTKYGQAAYVGPYTVTRVNNNGTLRYKKGVVTDVVNIRNAVPYKE